MFLLLPLGRYGGHTYSSAYEAKMFLQSVPNLDMEALSRRVRREVAAIRAAERPLATAKATDAGTPQLQRAAAPHVVCEINALEQNRNNLQTQPSLLVRLFQQLDPFRGKRLRDAERAELWSRLEGLAGDLRALQHSVGQFSHQLSQLASDHGQLVDRIGHLQNHIQNQLAELAQRAAATERSVAAMKGDVHFQNRRLARLDRGPVTVPGTPSRDQLQSGPADDLYLAFEDRFRGPIEEVKVRLQQYLDRFRGLPSLFPGRPLLDIGCGRGEWLELLSECGIDAYGVDKNPHAVDACKRRGLEARHADALTHLADLPDGALGAITIFHLVERLPLDDLLQLLEQARRTLVTGGLLMVQTPNPESIKVGASTFYNDPTHIRPIPPLLGQFLIESRGFIDVEILRLNPYPDASLVQERSEVADRLNELMFGSQDYAILARKA